jgi:hypothetical protein
VSKHVALAASLAAALSVGCGDIFIATSSDGQIVVAVNTTGSGLDSDGFILIVDGGAEQLVPSDGALTLTGLAEGTHSVLLSGLAGNCEVAGSNPQSVAVGSDGTASVAFDVHCAPAPVQRSRSSTVWQG